jgi:hypothetical protein
MATERIGRPCGGALDEGDIAPAKFQGIMGPCAACDDAKAGNERGRQLAPAGTKLIENLLAKGWIERRGLGNELSYRITDEGLDRVRRHATQLFA